MLGYLKLVYQQIRRFCEKFDSHRGSKQRIVISELPQSTHEPVASGQLHHVPTLHMHRQPRITRHVKKVFRMRESNKENNMEGSGTRKGEEDILKN